MYADNHDVAIWQRDQPDLEGGCRELFVSDAGATIIRTYSEDIIGIDSDGRAIINVPLFMILKAEMESACGATFGSYLPESWTDKSMWYFSSHEEQPYFVIRPWWGARKIFNLLDGQVVTNSLMVKAIAEHVERQFVVDILMSYRGRKLELDALGVCEIPEKYCAAVLLAGQLGVHEVANVLKELQDASLLSLPVSIGPKAPYDARGRISRLDYEVFTLRQIAKLALRRLGETPTETPVTRFTMKFANSKLDYVYRSSSRNGSRSTGVDSLTVGMSARQIIDTIGEPDFVDAWTWKYDIDAPSPFSLILKWDDETLKEIVRTPPQWMDGNSRDCDVWN